ncbi:MAG TPA: RdgB/HAM1 family non-canonical purine NTP pyrophosphatase [Sulfurivirga caldicuralii]|nr:RdgB/HAM1 family non-canonical purine NTP pyrophosphatase [Sulfurivirga caldicuralii]
MNPILLATGNPYKIQEIEPVLRQAGFDVFLQKDFFADEAIEDGQTFVENALKKARFACQKTGLPCLAEDSGLEVEALGGRPGVCSARYAGVTGASREEVDAANLRKLLKDMESVPLHARRARYCSVFVYLRSAEDAMPLIGTGILYGEILPEPRTGRGIGYDDVFWVPKYFKTVSEMSDELKNKISHRAQALREVLEKIKKDQV